MIYSIQPYNLNNRRNQVSFSGYNNKTYNVRSKNKMAYCIHETYFFRNIESLEFIRDYILKNFPKGTNIADFGCSNGEEAYSLGMLLSRQNKDQKYKITGYDLSQKVLNLAQSGPFERLDGKSESVINIDREYNISSRKYLRDLFFECFDKLPAKYLQSCLSNEQKQHLDEKIKNQKDLEKLLILKCIKNMASNPYKYDPGNIYLPKADFVKGVFDFKQGDINDISQILKPEGKTGVIIFKNAWYHVTGSRRTYASEEIELEKAEKIMKAANKILLTNGILVVGNLQNDHLYSGNQGRYLYQNDKRIKICDDTPFHNALRKSGFKPIFYEQIKSEHDENIKKEIYLPSVWQKAT